MGLCTALAAPLGFSHGAGYPGGHYSGKFWPPNAWLHSVDENGAILATRDSSVVNFRCPALFTGLRTVDPAGGSDGWTLTLNKTNTPLLENEIGYACYASRGDTTSHSHTESNAIWFALPSRYRLVFSAWPLEVTEGTSGTLNVRLNAAPSADVTLTLTQTVEDGDVTVSPSSLTFTADNWDTDQAVTVTVPSDDDGVDERNATGITFEVSTTDTNYSSLTNPTMPVHITDDDPISIVTSNSSLTMNEGDSTTLTVQLGTEPTASEVSVIVYSGRRNFVTIDGGSPQTLVFTPDNWNVAQSLGINAVQDDDAADIDTLINFNPSGGEYDDIPNATVRVTVDDDEAAGVVVSVTSVDLLEEGASVEFTVNLATNPTGAVTLQLTSDLSGVTVSPSSISFSRNGNWDDPQTVTLTANEDANQNHESGRLLMTFSMTGGYAEYASGGSSIVLNVTDNDAPRLLLQSTPASALDGRDLELDEGTSVSLRLSLSQSPGAGGASVALTPSAGSSDEITLSETSISFTGSNWDTPQSLTISAANDFDIEVETASIEILMTPGNVGDFENVTETLSISVIESNTRSLALSSTALALDEEGDGVSFTVRLDSEPTETVTLTAARTGSGEVSFAPAAAMTFSTAAIANPADCTAAGTQWNCPRTLTVSAASDEDSVDDAATITLTASGGDYGAAGITASLPVTVTDNDDVGLVLSASSLTISEGAQTSFSVGVATRPALNVSGSRVVINCEAVAGVTCTVTDAFIDGSSTWASQSATVTVRSEHDDDAADITGNVRIYVSAEGAGYATEYHDVSESIPLRVDDDETPGFSISRSSLSIDEEGAPVRFDVELDHPPTGALSVSLAADDATLTLSPAALSFTADNWDEAQTVTVTAVHDDDLMDATATIILTGEMTAGSAEYEALGDGIAVELFDNDVPQLEAHADPAGALGVDGLSFAEGASATVSFNLSGTPGAGGATIRLTRLAGFSDQITESATVLRFTDSNWGTEQSIVFSAEDDDDVHQAGGVYRLAMEPTVAGDFTTRADPLPITVIETNSRSLVLSETALSMTEQGDAAGFTVRLDSEPTDDVTITLAPHTDKITLDPSLLEFTADDWSAGQSVTVSAVADDDTDDDSTSISFSSSGGDYGEHNVTASLPITVTDDDIPGFRLSATELTVDEGGSATFTVALRTIPDENVTVRLVQPLHLVNSDISLDAVAVLIGDQSLTTFTPANWNVPQTITVSAAEDNDASADTGTISLSASTAGGSDGYDSVPEASVSVTVTENDETGIVLSATELDVAEGGSATFTVQLETPPSANLTVTLMQPANTEVTVDTQTGVGGNQNTLTFTDATWQTPQTVTVSAMHDGDAVADTATVSLSASGAPEYAALSGIDSVSISVIEDESIGVEISETALSVVEDGAAGEDENIFTVALSSEPSGSVTVDFASSDTGAATVSVAGGGTQLSFAPSDWGTGQVVTVAAVSDDDAFAELVTISLTVSGAVEYAGLSGLDSVSVTVSDDDPVGLALSKSTIADIAEGASDSFTVQLRSAPAIDITVTLSSSDASISPDAGAAPGVQSVLTFTPSNWSTPQTVTLNAVEDDNAFGETNVEVTLSASGSHYSDVEERLTVTGVTDNDAVGLQLTQVEGGISMREGGARSFGVQLLSEPANGAVTVSVVNQNPSAATVSPASLSFGPDDWQTPKSVSIRAWGDYNAADEMFSVDLSASGGDYAGVTASVDVEVLDNDTAAITLVPRSLTIDEDGSGTFDVYIDSEPTADVTLTLAQPDNSDVTIDTDSATPGNQNTLTFTPRGWTNSQQVTVSAASDDGADDESASVDIAASGGDYGAVTASLPVTVTDQDTRGLTLSQSALSVTEGGSGTFTVRLGTRPTADVLITLSAPNEAEATLDTDAVAAGDQSELQFTTLNWSQPQTVTVGALHDDDAFGPETADISLSASGGDYGGVSASLTVSIDDDDTPGLSLTFDAGGDSGAADGLSLMEGGSATFPVRLTTRPTGTVTVTLGAPSNPDVTVSPSSLSFTPSRWNRAQLVTLLAAEDEDSADDTATISLTSSGADYNDAETVNVDVDVIDNDAPNWRLSANSVTLDEGGSATFTVVPVSRPDRDVTAVLGQGGAANPDISFSPASLSFTPSDWRTARTVTVSAAHDADAFDDVATLDVTGASAGGYYDGISAGIQVSVEDDDTQSLVLSAAEMTVNETETGTFQVRLATLPSAPVTAVIGRLGLPTPTVSITPASMIFTPDNWNTDQAVSIVTSADDDALDERVPVGIRASGGDYNVAGGVAVTVADKDTARLVLSETALTIDEGSSGNAFTVKLATRPSADVTVRLTQPSNTDVVADAHSDLGNQTRLTFTTANWNAAQSITLSAAQDDDAGDDSAELVMTASGGDYEALTATLAVTVDDNDFIGLRLTPNPLTLGEGSTGTLSVSLLSKPSDTVMLALGVPSRGDIQADADPQQAERQNTLNIDADNWQQEHPIRISVGEDDDFQDDTATLEITAMGGGYDDTSATANLSITDDDTPELNLSSATLSVAEGESATFTVALASRPPGAVTVSLVQDPSGAIEADTDTSQSVPQSDLVFGPDNWDQGQTVTVRALQDLDAVPETVELALTAQGSGYDRATDSITVSVSDDETAGLWFSLERVEVGEGGTSSFGVRLLSEPAGDVTVTIAQPDNRDVRIDADAAAGGDQNTVMITPDDWLVVRRVTVRAAEDDDGQNDEAALNLSASGGDYGSVSAALPVVVRDNERPGLTLSQSAVTVEENDAATVSVRLDTRPTAARVTLSLQSADPGAVTVAPASLTFTQDQWNRDQTFTLTGARDADAANERTSVTLSASGADYGEVTASLSVRVTDDGRPRFVLSQSSLSLEEQRSSAVTVHLSNLPTTPVTVSAISTDDSVARVSPDELTFTPANWYQAQPLTVTGVRDSNTVADRASILLSSEDAEYDGEMGAVDVVVTDIDIPMLDLLSNDLVVTEGDTGALDVRLNAEPTGAVRIALAVTESRLAQVTPEQMIFTPENWNRNQTLIVLGLSDDDAQDERAEITLVAAGAEFNTVWQEIALEILDDDEQGLSVSESRLSVNESGSESFTVQLDTEPAGEVTLDLEVTEEGIAALSVTQLRFDADDWSTPKTVEVLGVQDDDSETGRTRLRITSSGADYRGRQASIDITVADDESYGITVSTQSLTVDEGSGGATSTSGADADATAAGFTVSLNSLPYEDVSVLITSDDEELAVVSPQLLLFTPWNWAEPQQVEVRGVEDDDAADERTFVTARALGALHSGAEASIDITIRDDDPAELRLSVRQLTVPEDGAATFTVALSTAPSVPVTVGLSSEGIDMEMLSPARLEFAPDSWDRPQAVTVVGVQDEDRSNDRHTLVLEAAGGEFSGARVDLPVLMLDDDIGVVLAKEARSAEKVLEEMSRSMLGSSADVIGRRFDAAELPDRTVEVGNREIGIGDEGALGEAFVELALHFGASGSVVDTGPGDAQLDSFGSIRLEDGLPQRGAGGDDIDPGAPAISAFTYPVSLGASGGSITTWARYDHAEFSGELNAVDDPLSRGGARESFRGNHGTIWFGVDQRTEGDVLFGAALSQGTGGSDYRLDNLSASMDTNLTMLMPYIELPMTSGFLRLMMGFGGGELELTQTSGEKTQADLWVQIFSLGAKWPVARLGRTSVALTGSIGSSRVKTARSTMAALRGLSSVSGRVSAGLEVAHDGLGESWRVTPRFGLSMRQDSGQNSKGIGTELLWSMRLSAPVTRLSVDAGLRWLGMHAEDNYQEWSGSVELQLKPRDSAGRGLAMTLGPEWGEQHTGALEREEIFRPGEVQRRARGAGAGRMAVKATLGYGLDIHRGLLTPFAEYSILGGERSAARLMSGLKYRDGERLEARLFRERQASWGARARGRIGLELNRRF
ncbi:MAG: hypothetical protein ISN29_10225 [Gammaproteobacteria bacterium AqS3]|nr:hypothetical protein [Gammaproteobacteria bacterium AqS3]